ncbi:MAG: hypothetical protein WCH61_03560 [bacterium]
MKLQLSRLTNLVVRLSLAGVVIVLSGCHGIPPGTTPAITLAGTVGGAVTLTATGAGLVNAEAQKTSFKIECTLCGYESAVITIDTPVPGKPYTLDWVCPQCGHRQKITIGAVPAVLLPAK